MKNTLSKLDNMLIILLSIFLRLMRCMFILKVQESTQKLSLECWILKVYLTFHKIEFYQELKLMILLKILRKSYLLIINK